MRSSSTTLKRLFLFIRIILAFVPGYGARFSIPISFLMPDAASRWASCLKPGVPYALPAEAWAFGSNESSRLVTAESGSSESPAF